MGIYNFSALLDGSGIEQLDARVYSQTNREKKLLEKLNQFNLESALLLDQSKRFDRIQGWNWFIFAFVMVPLFVIMFIDIAFDIVLFEVVNSHLFSFFVLIVVQFLFLQYIRKKCSLHYEKLFAKQKRARSICFVLQKPHPEKVLR